MFEKYVLPNVYACVGFVRVIRVKILEHGYGVLFG